MLICFVWAICLPYIGLLAWLGLALVRLFVCVCVFVFASLCLLAYVFLTYWFSGVQLEKRLVFGLVG